MSCGAHDILWLDIQMDDVPFMHVFDPLADLSHVVDNLGLRHSVALCCDPLEQLAPGEEFKNKNHLVFIFKGVVEINQLAVVEMVHDVNLLSDQSLLHGVTDGNKLGSVDMLSFQLTASMNHAKRSSTNLLEDVVVVINTVLGLDFHRLWDVLGVDVEDKLVIVPDLALLTTDLLSSLGINFISCPGCFLLEGWFGLAHTALITGVRPTIHVLSKHSESIFISRNESCDWHQSEPGVANTTPTCHGQLLLLHDIVSDG